MHVFDHTFKDVFSNIILQVNRLTIMRIEKESFPTILDKNNKTRNVTLNHNPTEASLLECIQDP